MTKVYFVIRTDLEMSPAKIAVQVGHGTDFIHLESSSLYQDWIKDLRKKIVVQINSLQKLENLIETLKLNNIVYNEIWDAGLTELNGPTLTGIVVHPINDIPKQIQRLRLY